MSRIIEKRIEGILENLLEYEDIYACMLVRKDLEGIIPPINKFKKGIEDIWEILQEVMEEIFTIIDKYSKYGYGLSEIYFTVMDYEIIFYVIPETDTALVVIIPSLSNKGLIEIIVENTRRKIIDIIGA